MRLQSMIAAAFSSQAPLLRVASPYNRSATELVTASGALVDVAFRLFKPVGSGSKKSLSIRIDNWYYSSATAISPGAEISYPYGLGIELNGITVPLTMGGQPLTNYTLAAGAWNVRPDLLYASRFGLSEFPWGISARVRGVQRGVAIPVSGAVDLQDVCRKYDPTAASCDSPLGTGALTFTGSHTATTTPFITLIGENTNTAQDLRAYAVNCDSIGWQSSTQSYPMAALEGANVANQLIAGVILGRSGGDAAVVNNHPNEIGSFMELCGGVVDLYGTNTIGNATPATLISRTRGNYAVFRARKSTHPLARDPVILRMPLLMKGLQGDPVITNGWNAGQDVQIVNDLLAAEVGIPGGSDVFLDQLSLSPYLIRASATGKDVFDSDYHKYAAGKSVDKNHPSAAGASGVNGLGANLRPTLLYHL